jgi:hypothetical protein
MRLLLPGVLVCLMLGLPVAEASHDWGGIDVCKTYRDRVPPGLDPALLPEPGSRGAQLLERYCTQCHELPGPGRHTAEEWPAVLERMVVLMDVSRRFRGLMGRIVAPSAEERAALDAYLSAHALRPMRGTPRGPGAAEFAQGCGGCHALPDPRQHTREEWHGVVARMQRNAAIMQRGGFDAPATQAILTYLGSAAGDRYPGDPHGAGVSPRQLASDSGAPDWTLRRLAYLIPFFAVAVLGVLRWWHAARAGRVQP